MVNNLSANVGDASSIPRLGRSPGVAPTPVFLPRQSHGQRSLAVYSSWGCKESDMTEHAQESEFIAKEQSESQQIKDLLEETSGVKEVLAKLT